MKKGLFYIFIIICSFTVLNLESCLHILLIKTNEIVCYNWLKNYYKNLSNGKHNKLLLRP